MKKILLLTFILLSRPEANELTELFKQQISKDIKKVNDAKQELSELYDICPECFSKYNLTKKDIENCNTIHQVQIIENKLYI